jgi:phospholipid/cholesterol/gamma-HCH transport system ATP-binding protein
MPGPAMNISPAILKFDEVTIESGPLYETGLSHSSLELCPGELLLLRLERENERLPIADAAEGLVPPVRGSVRFCGENWQAMTADQAAAQRGKIGRLFEDEGWISDLEVDQNIMLSQQHHTARREEDIRDEALGLARAFGLPGLPRGRPGSLRRWDLRKAACIRTFLGQPLLVILEQPVRGVYADLMAPLVNATRSACRRGAAVLWMVSDPKIWNHPGIRATVRARMFGSELNLVATETLPA